MLRDILVREEPLIFKPGEFYALAALAGVLLFIASRWGCACRRRPPPAGIGLAFTVRLLSIRLGWRTGAFEPTTGSQVGDERPLGCS